MSKLNFELLSKLFFLISIDQIGPSRALNLISKFKDISNVLSADYVDLIKVGSISEVLAKKIVSAKSSLSNSQKEFEKQIKYVEKIGGTVLSFWDDEYPELLKRIYSPPILIYTLGEFSKQDEYSLAVVGTRKPTRYGITQAEKFVKEISEQRITIVSGLARGIDSVAHSSALKFNNRTIAVVGSGLDIIYPSENRRLFDKTAENGIIISEFKCGTKPDAQNFPKRNRIISGISLGTLVVETNLTGGAMQTAAYALDQNREVFAVPGNLNVSQSEGTNRLIQRGEAKLVTNAQDILEELQLHLKPEVGKNIPKPSVELNFFEEKIYNSLTHNPTNIDAIAEKVSSSTSECLIHLLTLEFKGLISQLPGKNFKLN